MLCRNQCARKLAGCRQQQQKLLQKLFGAFTVVLQVYGAHKQRLNRVTVVDSSRHGEKLVQHTVLGPALYWSSVVISFCLSHVGSGVVITFMKESGEVRDEGEMTIVIS